MSPIFTSEHHPTAGQACESEEVAGRSEPSTRVRLRNAIQLQNDHEAGGRRAGNRKLTEERTTPLPASALGPDDVVGPFPPCSLTHTVQKGRDVLNCNPALSQRPHPDLSRSGCFSGPLSGRPGGWPVDRGASSGSHVPSAADSRRVYIAQGRNGRPGLGSVFSRSRSLIVSRTDFPPPKSGRFPSSSCSSFLLTPCRPPFKIRTRGGRLERRGEEGVAIPVCVPQF
ncbi:hypothetical protein B0J18DRAFT_119316 [Chaetomium sp. MPI-SDFR-AT-0129]|nr:hypothetical protein B0J18DRAFT_119316 [Chaetomium sp. MPI-SDFR-AT-0129]